MISSFLRMIASLVGLTIETARDLAIGYLSFVWRVSIVAIVLLATSGLLFWWGNTSESGILVGASIILATITLAFWMAVTILLSTTVAKIAQKFPLAGEGFAAIGEVLAFGLFLAFYLQVTHAQRHPFLFKVIMSYAVVYVSVLAWPIVTSTGRTLRSSLRIVLSFFALSLIPLNLLPEAFWTQFDHPLEQVVLKNQQQLYPTVEQITKKEFRFFSEYDGKPVVYYVVEDGKILLFKEQRVDPITQESYRPVTKDVVSRYIKQLRREDSLRQAELKAQQDAAAKAARDSAQEKASAEQKAREEEQARQETEKQQSAEWDRQFEELKKKRAEEKAPYVSHILATAEMVIDKDLRTDRLSYGTQLQGKLTQPLQFAGYTFPRNSSVALVVASAFPGIGRDEASIVLIPTTLSNGSRNQMIQFEAEPIKILGIGQQQSDILIPKKFHIKKDGLHIKVPANYPLQLRLKAGPS